MKSEPTEAARELAEDIVGYVDGDELDEHIANIAHDIDAFAARAVEAEREACEGECESILRRYEAAEIGAFGATRTGFQFAQKSAKCCAAAIRARKGE